MGINPGNCTTELAKEGEQCDSFCLCGQGLLCTPNILCRNCGNICMAADFVSKLVQYYDIACNCPGSHLGPGLGHGFPHPGWQQPPPPPGFGFVPPGFGPGIGPGIGGLGIGIGGIHPPTETPPPPPSYPTHIIPPQPISPIVPPSGNGYPNNKPNAHRFNKYFNKSQINIVNNVVQLPFK
jgi:hypothetical protein